MNYNRSIKTNLVGQTNLTILENVMGQLSDGMWENSPAMVKWWRFASIGTDANGAVVIQVNDILWDSGYRGLTDEEILAKFAGWLKKVVQQEIEDNFRGEWKRTDRTRLAYLDDTNVPVTVADAYAAYDVLKGRDQKKLADRAENKAVKDAAIAAKKAEIFEAELLLARLRNELSILSK